MTTPQNSQPFLPLRTAVVLLIAFVIGVVMGILAGLAGAPVAGAVAVGLTSTGASVPVLCTLIR
ncbi:hypothetical protein OG866_01265 [Streptomyces sp. NBC_00663]|uniref:hypothetical protein n=1 Tax=Streptomyces sp. NBC_00663 TaxID=2975801 RepID=UPI002E3667EB|nr:hypothetical protein [Streptomyces sp. NBC_00663]